MYSYRNAYAKLRPFSNPFGGSFAVSAAEMRSSAEVCFSGVANGGKSNRKVPFAGSCIL